MAKKMSVEEILAAARALDLDFGPLFNEQYQLIVPFQHYDGPILASLLEILRGSEFKAAVDALGGYDATDMGRLVWQSSRPFTRRSADCPAMTIPPG